MVPRKSKAWQVAKMCIKEFWRHFHRNAGSLNTFDWGGISSSLHFVPKCHLESLQRRLLMNFAQCKKVRFWRKWSGRLKFLKRQEAKSTFSLQLLNPHFLDGKIVRKSDLKQRAEGEAQRSRHQDWKWSSTSHPPHPHMGVHTGPIRGPGSGAKIAQAFSRPGHVRHCKVCVVSIEEVNCAKVVEIFCNFSFFFILCTGKRHPRSEPLVATSSPWHQTIRDQSRLTCVPSAT